MNNKKIKNKNKKTLKSITAKTATENGQNFFLSTKISYSLVHMDLP
jgi:hypothetical protein